MTEPKFLIHQTTHQFMSDSIHLQITLMKSSTIVWAGKADGRLGEMSVALPPSTGSQMSSATTIMGKSVTDQSKSLARKLASKYNQQFYVSLDVSSENDLLFVFVEKKIVEMLKNILA